MSNKIMKKKPSDGCFTEESNEYDRLTVMDMLVNRFPAELFEEADRVRKQHVGNGVYLRGIIEFSNHCVQDCLYCGLRYSNANLKRYRMSDDEILNCAEKVKASGIGTVVLQSGEDAFYSAKSISGLVERIKSETGLVVTLSIGEWPLEDYELFRAAGADRYLLKHETSDSRLYKRLRPECSLVRRVSCLRHLKNLGFETGSGIMVGLPGQTLESLADDIILFRNLDIDMIGIGPFIPHHETPLKSCPSGDAGLVLKMIAATRIVTKNTNIPATTALTTLDPQNRVRSLMAGANVIMPDFTPPKYRRLYDIYPGKGSSPSNPEEIIKGIRRDVEKAGRMIGAGPGDRKINNSAT
jgi:biotin synthase